MPHQDVLEEAVMMKVSPDKVDELTRFDGSLTVKRTEGIVAARCDREEMNIAALNLANDIVTGKKTVDQARKQLGDIATRVKRGEMPAEATKLNFTPSQNAMDADAEMSASGAGSGSGTGAGTSGQRK